MHSNYVTLDTSKKEELKKSFISFVDIEYTKNQSYSPQDIIDELITFGESFYLDGYTNKSGFEKINCKIDELKNLDRISRNLDKQKHCYFESFSQAVCQKNLNTYKNASNQNCSLDPSAPALINGVVPKKVRNEDGSQKIVTKHYDIFKTIYTKYINYVLKIVDENKGQEKNEKQNATAAKCIEGLIRDLDYRRINSNSCIESSKECSGHLDCCTGVCLKVKPSDNKGVCSAPYTCYKEIALNQKCGAFSDGFTNSHCKEGLCIDIDYNSSDINECKAVKKSCSQNSECCSDNCSNNKCEAQSKCLECTGNGEAPTATKACCPGLYKSTKGKCIPDFPPLILPIVKSFFKKLIPIAFAQGLSDEEKEILETSEDKKCVPGVNCKSGDVNQKATLSAEQTLEIQRDTSNCIAMADEAQKASCFDQVAIKRKNFLVAQGDGAGLWDRRRYLESYNATAITSKTYSDPKKCEFNSFNDSWRDMSNVQRNAEMMVRGFEYVYTGNGTQDYWVNKQGKNIFSRAQEIAKELRINRSNLIKKMHKTDISMACQCIAVFGPNKFSVQKQAFFNSGVCDEEKAAIAQMNIGNVDGQSQSENEIKAQEGEVSEIDAGASGISHEKMLVEWLRLKYETQMERFTLNAKVEEQMNELVEFTVEDTDWEKGKMEQTELYKFTVRKMSGWFAFVIASVLIVVVASIIFFTGGIAAGALFSSWTIGGASFATFALVAVSLHSAIWGKEHNHHFNDHVRRDWHCINWLCTHKDKDLTRYYVAPHYKNFSLEYKGVANLNLKSHLKCDVRATSSQCLKNSYRTNFNDEPRFLLDIKNPLFVDFQKRDLSTNHVNEINKSFDRGIKKLKETYPGSRTNVRFLNQNFLGQKEYIEKFMIKDGNYAPSVFSDKLKEKVLKGARTYAQCKELTKCEAPKEYEGQMGFGYLFESKIDIKNFAEYVYQHHFHWPSLTAYNHLGYPLMAQRAYFETVFHNIRLVGSLAAAQGAGYGDAYFRYRADWDTRRGIYDVAGNVTLGNQTQNVQYSRQFLDTFNMLNFSTADGISAFDKNYKSLKSSGNLNSYETAALDAASGSAQRALSAKKKLDNYNKQTENNNRSLAKRNAQVNYLNKIGAPLNSRGLTVGGSDLGNTGDIYKNGGGLTKSAIAKSLSESEKKKNKRTQVAALNQKKYQDTSYQKTNIANFDNDIFNSNTESSNDSLSKNIKASGMGEDEIERMLSASKKDKNLKNTEGDNIFTAVSKAYKRNYNVFFKRKNRSLPSLEIKKENDIDSKRKKKLKSLLEN